MTEQQPGPAALRRQLYLEKSAMLRNLAESAKTKEARNELIFIAGLYERIARLGGDLPLLDRLL